MGHNTGRRPKSTTTTLESREAITAVMPASITPPSYRFFAPEVIQTSAMDCGPAALKCLLAGFGIPVSYGRLREACQTAVDGTSIDTIEDVACQLGLQAAQMIAPVDHLLLAEANLLPALVVTRLPDGLPHFIIVWRVVGPWVQVMDPATGRRWLPRRQLLQDLYRHAIPFPADAWRAWAGGAGFIAPLRIRLEKLHLPAALVTTLVEQALVAAHWKPLAALDAAARFVETLAQTGGIQRGEEASHLLTSLLASEPSEQPGAGLSIPAPFWFVQQLLPSRAQGLDAPEQLLLRGAVLIQVQGRRPVASTVDEPAVVPSAAGHGQTASAAARSSTPLPPALAAALTEPPNRPEWLLWRTLHADGLFTPFLLCLASLLAAAMVTLETVLLRGLLTLTPMSSGGRQTFLWGIALFTLLLLLLDLPITNVTLRMGRRLEARLRIALLSKLPRLGDQYFRSRLISDMATRAHGLHRLHTLPELALRTGRLGVQLLLTAAALIWLYPVSAPFALLATGFVLGLAVLTQPLLSERDMRVRTHTGALSRFYLDALLGLTPVRTHSAAHTVRREHEMRLVAWARANLAFYDLQRLTTAVVTLSSTGFAIAIVLRYLTGGGEASGVLLLLYWTLNLTALGQAFLAALQQYPIQRNHVLRLLEPLGAPAEDDQATRRPGDQATTARPLTLSPPHPLTPSSTGVAIDLRNVTVVAGGHTILPDLTLQIAPGEHVAIVGPSGAGKSSLVGLLLGWQRAASGQLLVDGAPLDGSRLLALRRMTAWVDPAIQLWNRTLFANLTYGAQSPGDSVARLGAEPPALDMTAVLDGADLYDVLEKLPSGLQTPLGENGGLVSGGEGQRVRLGRALLRSGVRLAILDEPFRGLDRGKRQQLLRNARAHWQGATLLCVTHDISATQDFTRVLVLEEGQIVEDGAPATLLAQPQSRYQALLTAEATVRQSLWTGRNWRRLWLADGALRE